MINGVRGVVCVAMFCLAACGSPSSGTISGKVTFADGSDASGLPVTLLGGVGKRIDTGAGGTYSFDKLPRGVYQVSVEGPDTRERRISFGTESDGSTAVTAPDLVFNALASLTGKVTNAAGPVAGATVYLSGSDRVSLTDAAGSFGFFDVPVGEYSLVAKASGQLAQQASAVVKLKRGKNEAMPLLLSTDLSAPGIVTGTLALFNGGSPKDIKVSVAEVSTMTDDSGSFTLTLPPGEYEPMAEQLPYKKQSLGLVTVRTGQTTRIPLKTLSLFTAFPWQSRISGVFWTATCESDLALLTVYLPDTDYDYEHYFVDTKTFERKLFALGSISRVHLSKNGKWVAFLPNTGRGVVAINSASGQTHSFPVPFLAAGPMISNDENTMMFYAGAPQNALVRVDLATGMSTSFPAFSGSFFQTNERFVAKSTAAGAFDAQLITATTASTVFNNMLSLNGLAPATYSGTSAFNLAWAYNCAAACDVQVLGSTASNSARVTATVPTAPSPVPGSVKDWLGLQWAGVPPGKVLIKVADGTATTLPATTTALLFNETASRVVTYSSGGLGTDLREDIVPPNATSTVHFTAPSIQAGGWLSPTRFMAFGAGPTKRVDLKNGVPTSDTDVTLDTSAQSPAMLPPGVIWVKASTMKRMAAVYDSTDLAPDTLGITSNYNFDLVGSRSSVTNSSLGKFAAFSDGANVFVLDGVKSEARKVGVGSVTGNFGTFVPTDRMKIQRLGGLELQYFESGRVISLSEPGQNITSSGIASVPKGGTAAVAVKAYEPTNVLYLAYIP